MNKDVFAGWWKQARGQAKSWWGQLTDDELDQIEGESDKLVGYLQTRYGWTREQAEEEIAGGWIGPPKQQSEVRGRETALWQRILAQRRLLQFERTALHTGR